MCLLVIQPFKFPELKISKWYLKWVDLKSEMLWKAYSLVRMVGGVELRFRFVFIIHKITNITLSS